MIAAMAVAAVAAVAGVSFLFGWRGRSLPNKAPGLSNPGRCQVPAGRLLFSWKWKVRLVCVYEHYCLA